MNDQSRHEPVSRARAGARNLLFASLSLLGAVACGASDDVEQPLATVELEDGNIVSFDQLGEGISVTEVGLASNGSHLATSGRSAIELFRELAPGRELPEALVAQRERSVFWSDLGPGTLVFPSRAAYERFDLSTLDRSKLDPNGPTWMGERSSSAPATLSRAQPSPPQTGGFQQNAGVCGSFIASQCNLQSAGLLGSGPDNLVVLPNIDFRIDDNEAARGVHLMCAADGNATLRVFVPELPNQGTGRNRRFIAEGSFVGTQWEMPMECIDFGDGPIGDAPDDTICFIDTAFVSVDARQDVEGQGSFHYCRAYDSNPN